MPAPRSTTPADRAVSNTSPLGVLDTKVGASSPTSAIGPGAVLSTNIRKNDYAPHFIDDVHSYIREHIRNADRKAVFFFGATTALLAFLHSVGASSRWLKPVPTWTVMDAITFVGMLTLAAAAMAAAFTVVPRLPGPKGGMLYFNAIAKYGSPSEYAAGVFGVTEHVLVTEKAEHCHVLARICRTKYRCLCVSLWLSFVGLAGTFAFLLFSNAAP